MTEPGAAGLNAVPFADGGGIQLGQPSVARQVAHAALAAKKPSEGVTDRLGSALLYFPASLRAKCEPTNALYCNYRR